MQINMTITPKEMEKDLARLFALSGQKIMAIEKEWDPSRGTPVFTVNGKYTTRGWTEWTQGFQYGSALLQFEATGEESFLEVGRKNTVQRMAPHVSNIGVHDHGFNNVSTYGNLRRLMREGRIPFDQWEMNFYELALKVSGAVQASRWSPTAYGSGYIRSFNGPHSLFCDTIRSLRALALAHRLGHVLMGEGDRPISLLARAIEHARTTAMFNVYYGTGRDNYDVRGRVAHESIFNTTDGCYRCPSTQQGYSPFSTWTRGLSWVICGYAEQLEFLATVDDGEYQAALAMTRKSGALLPATASLPPGVPEIDISTKEKALAFMLDTALAAADFWIENTPLDGIPYWDTGAPGLVHLGDYLCRPADPYNNYEPVDSSAAAIAAQGFIRLGRFLSARKGEERDQAAAGLRYIQAGRTIAAALIRAPYLSEDPGHQGLLLHSIYHRPNNWDYVPPQSRISHSESSMWGDYHLRELAVMLWRELKGEPNFTFYA
ncbi:MAG TPA: glycosyl hydrolase [Firmicutes bacterium]|nr:glycosyl hydrolase [Bacillota bacterium]